MSFKTTYLLLFWGFAGILANGQDVGYNEARNLAYGGDYIAANTMLTKLVGNGSKDKAARSLLASTYSWNGEYDKARDEFNIIVSSDRENRDVWIAAIKNELYAKNNATAIGLANKALVYLDNDAEVERLKKLAEKGITDTAYPESGWFNQDDSVEVKNEIVDLTEVKAAETPKLEGLDTLAAKTPVTEEVFKNKVSVRNSATVYDTRYDPMFYSSISYNRQTLAGTLIPRINYSNRLETNGVQYELDFYPKFSNRFYAYLNYGLSNASIYPKHKFGGDLYANLPGAFEFSAGGRYISYDNTNVSVITNSLGHYRGNYYISLRSYITPMPDNLTRFSGNLLVRKYLKDAENYLGLNLGMGYSPELRQLTSGDELLAETLLYVESQRLSLEYQFTGKNNPNIYRANLGATRQELAFASGQFFYGVSAGITYEVKF
ncbi:YaiO family outer membrane beta-barrel protein [Zobellia uliginosa]|uniref:YaiO family outer membrane beta-barrel protein n=1 Tax=Zobellia uliginosa TaxID=143224 RepID=UPI001C06CC48|nr:YaiO family outer membrane beta-barrel protein [Zobellia uliginosa]MBU2946425.1 YaiO family outer membrane beta-barrel protein [Zobellia uliginosa]